MSETTNAQKTAPATSDRKLTPDTRDREPSAPESEQTFVFSASTGAQIGNVPNARKITDAHNRNVPNARKMTGAQAVIASLEAQGVRVLFGYPGAQAIRVYDALYDSQKLTHVLARHEQAATHMADGFARATGKAGVVLVTSGPGATNTVTGIATAYMDSVPLVVITCNVSLETIGTDGFQEADITSITMPIVKHSFLLKCAGDIPRTFREAFHIASTGRPGPVLIDIPANLLEQEITFEYPRDVSLPSYRPTYIGNKRQIRMAAELICQARRPVFYVGGGVVSSSASAYARPAQTCQTSHVSANGGRAGAETGDIDAESAISHVGADANAETAHPSASAQLMRIANALQIPCVYTLMGKGAVPDSSPLCAGFVGMHGAVYANLALTRADVIIACGVRFDARVTGDIARFAPEAKIIHIDIDPAEIDKIRKVDVPIVGDVGRVLEALADELGVPQNDSAGEKTGDPSLAYSNECSSEQNTCACKKANHQQTQPWLQQIDEWKREYPLTGNDVGAENSALGPSISPENTISELSRQLDPQNSIVITEVGQHQMWTAQLTSRDLPRTFITSGGLGTMGFGFPAAIGAAIALKASTSRMSRPGVAPASPEASSQENKTLNPKLSTQTANNTSSTPQVVCIAGDGSLQMNNQEMATATSHNLPIKILLINNSCLGMVHQFQQLFYNERYSQTELTCNPDFVKLSHTYGWQASRVVDPAQVSVAIKTMLDASGPYLLEVIVSRERNVYPMVAPNASLEDGIENPETTASTNKTLQAGVENSHAVGLVDKHTPETRLFAKTGDANTVNLSNPESPETRHVLAVTVENVSGVLSRVASLISRRGFNVESLSVGPTQDPKKSRITVVVWANNRGFEQITKQLNKLVSVYKVTDLTDNDAIERELVLIKVNADAKQRGEIIQVANIFRANIVDVSPMSLSIEATGNENKIRGLEDLLRPYGISEMVRTGKIALGRNTKN